MAREFLAYWEPETVDEAQKGDGHDNHAASNQFRRMKVSKGDTVWFVTVRNGKLCLVTRIVVGHVTSQRGAARLLGCRPSKLYDAKDHIIAASGTEPALNEQDIHANASQLRFDSPRGKDRLTLDAKGNAKAQQLQTMRILTPASAKLLARIITSRNPQADSERSERVSDRAGGGFGQAEQNTQVEEAAIQAVQRWYRRRGWSVVSVEKEGCGFDLLCNRDGQEVHVEVKGVSGDAERFIATANEVRRAREDDHFVLAFVPDALSQKPAIHFWSGRYLCDAFRFDPIQFLVSRHTE